MPRGITVAIITSLLLVACTQAPPAGGSPSPSASTLVGDPWELVTLRGETKAGSGA